MLQCEGINFREAVEAAKLLCLPPGLKRKYLARMGRMGIAQTKKNVSDQKTVDGLPMQPRKKYQQKQAKIDATGKGKITANDRRKMFTKMVGGKFLRVKLSDDAAWIAFGRADAVAYKHHHGLRSTYEAYNYPVAFDTSKVQTRLNREASGDQCSANQAATLIRLNFLPPQLRELPSGTAAKLRYVMQNVTKKQAMFLIKKGKEKLSKSTLPYKIPARPVLGANQRQIVEWGDLLITSLDEKFQAKQYGQTLI